MKLTLTVKELSDIVGLPPRRIRYYDEIGLFKPTGVDPENGYHYYALEKIEELRLIMYLRHLNVPISEIRLHLENRNLSDYAAILKNQLKETYESIESLSKLASRLEMRLRSIEYIHSLPPLDKITIQKLPERAVLSIYKEINEPLEWERDMLSLEKDANLPPSIFIGDIGFYVDLSKIKTRHATQFTGLYLFADDLITNASKDVLPAGDWLTVTFKGDHHAAPPYYRMLLNFAHVLKRKPLDFAIERVLVDHFISSDPDFYLTEIQMPLKSE